MIDDKNDENKIRFRIFCTNPEQFAAFLRVYDNCRVYVDRIYLDADNVLDDPESWRKLLIDAKSLNPELSLYLSLPQVLREKDHPYLEQLYFFMTNDPVFEGILCGNLEGIGFWGEKNEGSEHRFRVIADHNFYLWNRDAYLSWKDQLDGACIPLELKEGEERKLLDSCNLPEKRSFFFDKIIYGYLPMMLTANCVAKTDGDCRALRPEKWRETISIRDRKGVLFPVQTNCRHCFNVIYNSCPLSLHAQMEKWKRNEVGLRMHFTMETAENTEAILRWFWKNQFDDRNRPFFQYTTGHEKRGVL